MALIREEGTCAMTAPFLAESPALPAAQGSVPLSAVAPRALEPAPASVLQAPSPSRGVQRDAGMGRAHGQMPQTSWTLVLTARDLGSSDAQGSLAKLCETYWLPLHTFVRGQGVDHHRAEDLTQAFFAHLLDRPWLAGVDRAKGRFRTFMLHALCNFLNNERAKDRTLKRGGNVREFVPYESERTEGQPGPEPTLDPTALLEFDRQWACALVQKALAAVEQDYGRCDKTDLFQALSPYMVCPVPVGHYADASARLNMTEGALRVAMHRLLRRFGELLRVQVAWTVAGPEAVDEELREVLKAWARE